jgi:hypothetical protein
MKWLPNGLRHRPRAERVGYLRVGVSRQARQPGVDNAWSRTRSGSKPRAREMLENAAHTHLFTALLSWRSCRTLYWALSAFRNLLTNGLCPKMPIEWKHHETKLFSCQRDHQGLHIRHEYPHSPSAHLALNRSGKDNFKSFFGDKLLLLFS